MFRLRTRLSCAVAAAALAAIAALAGSARADLAVDYQALALTNDVAPGTGGFWRGFEAPAINAAGQVAFYGLYGPLNEPPTISTPGIWSNSSGSFVLAANVGGPAPGVSGLSFTGFGGARVGIGGTGDLVFTGSLNSGNTANDRGIWYGPAGTVGLLAREDDTVPDADETQPPFNGTEPAFNNNLGLAVIGPGGHGGFTSPMTNDDSNGLHEHSFFIQSGGTLRALAIAGTQVPGEDDGTLYGGVATTLRINTVGQAAFAAELKGDAEPTNPSAIFFGPAGDARVVAAAGRQAPGMTGVTFSSFNSPDLNDDGQLAFAAGLTNFDSDADPFKGEAIYFGSLGSIAPIAKIGDTVGGVAGLMYAEFATDIGPTMNDAGQVTFLATTSNDDLVIMAGAAGDPDDLIIVGREGVNLPTGFTLLDGPLLNNSGDVAFSISEASGDTSLWIADLFGNLHRIVGSGDLFEVAEGDERTVTAVKIGTTIDGYRFLTDDGTVAFGLLFDDGSEGIFTATVPEPASAALVLGALGLLLRRRR